MILFLVRMELIFRMCFGMCLLGRLRFFILGLWVCLCIVMLFWRNWKLMDSCSCFGGICYLFGFDFFKWIGWFVVKLRFFWFFDLL